MPSSPDTPTAAEARAIGITSAQLWPYGPNHDHQARRALVNWATRESLCYSPTGQCLDWLRYGDCRAGHDHTRPPWMDHLTGWTRNGKPAMLVSQPYGLTRDCLAELADLDRSDLPVSIDGTGWYGHGTLFITVTAPTP